jgi:hypothetical protein
MLCVVCPLLPRTFNCVLLLCTFNFVPLLRTFNCAPCSALSGFAFNLAIPVLVKLLGDSTVVPLLRAVALPLAALVAMSRLDPVIATSFDWDALVGLTLAFAGLLVCYLPPNRVCACIATPPPPLEHSSGNVQY